MIAQNMFPWKSNEAKNIWTIFTWKHWEHWAEARPTKVQPEQWTKKLDHVLVLFIIAFGGTSAVIYRQTMKWPQVKIAGVDVAFTHFSIVNRNFSTSHLHQSQTSSQTSSVSPAPLSDTCLESYSSTRLSELCFTYGSTWTFACKPVL